MRSAHQTRYPAVTVGPVGSSRSPGWFEFNGADGNLKPVGRQSEKINK